jgi:hypothetical protein
MKSIEEWGRADIRAQTAGEVVHLTKYAFDGPGRRRRPIDQLRDDGVISAAGHAGAERYLDVLAMRTPKLSGSQTDYSPNAPCSRCLTSDVRLDAADTIVAARQSVVSAVGRMGWGLLSETLQGSSLASCALLRGYTRGMGTGDARRMHSQVRDAYDALGAHFAESDKLARGAR